MISLRRNHVDRQPKKMDQGPQQLALVTLDDHASGVSRRLDRSGSDTGLMPPLKHRPVEIWRFQRDEIYPDVITGMTKDKKRWVFVTAGSDPKLHRTWLERFGGRHTIYVQAMVGPSTKHPSIRIIRFVESW